MAIEKDFLREEQYKNAINYERRMSILKYSESPIDPWRWLAKFHDFTAAKNILEVGCGPGTLWQYIDKKQLTPQQRLLLTDLSAGMLAIAKTNITKLHLPCVVDFAVADVENLEFADDNFDTVLAHLMIYHASSPERAVTEIKRVMTVTGSLYASTLFPFAFQEGFQLAHDIDQRIPPYTMTVPFSPEKAAVILAKHFKTINKEEFVVDLKIPDVELIVNIIRGYPPVQKLALPEAFFQDYQSRVETVIRNQGYLKTRFGMVVFHCIDKL